MSGRGARLSTVGAILLLGTLLAIGTIVALRHGPAAPVASPRDGPPVRLAGPDVFSGETIDLREFEGRAVVINIWASWCSGCNAEADELAAFAAAHDDVVVVGLNIQDTPEAAREFYARHGWELPSIADPDGALSFRLGLRGTPTTIFLDRGHREAARIVGETDRNGLEDGLAQALAG